LPGQLRAAAHARGHDDGWRLLRLRGEATWGPASGGAGGDGDVTHRWRGRLQAALGAEDGGDEQLEGGRRLRQVTVASCAGRRRSGGR
jgi:hypothetical protein